MGERCQWVLEVGWLLNTSWPGGLSRDSAARARACPVPAREQQVPGQSPEMCPWGRRSQCSRGDRSQRLAASSAVSSHHICFKACGALALWDTPWLAEEQGSRCCSPWASEDAAFGWRWDPCVSYKDIGLLPLLLLLVVRELMATTKPTPYAISTLTGAQEYELFLAGSWPLIVPWPCPI